MLLSSYPDVSSAASAGDMLRQSADTLSDLGSALRDADDARDRYNRNKSDRDADRYEREWREQEYKFEESRIDRMAKEANVSRSQIRDMREDGKSWNEIGKRYNVDPQKVNYGHKGPGNYDRDNDRDLQRRYYKEHPGKARGHYKGTKDGPPGQYKKDKKDKKNKKKKGKDLDS